MSKTITEQKVLNKLDIPDFRHMTKDKVMSFASMLPDMDPEVAKKALEQFPEFAKTILEITKNYKETLEKGLEENAASTKVCYNACNAIIESLQKLLEKEDLSYEERKDITDKMIEVSKMMSDKDSENKNFTLKVLAIAGLATAVVSGGVVAVLGGKTNINLPKKI